MGKIEWDDSYFRERGLYIWIYNKGKIISTNEEIFKPELLRIYYQSKTRSINNLIINRNNKGDIQP
jgi:hypothetical protein